MAAPITQIFWLHFSVEDGRCPHFFHKFLGGDNKQSYEFLESEPSLFLHQELPIQARPPQALCSDKLKQRNVAALLRCVSLGCSLLLDEFVDDVRECEAWTDFLCVHATTMLELEYANTAAMATPKRSFFPFLCQDE